MNITDTPSRMSDKVLEDISNEQAGVEGPRRSRRSLNRKGAEGASKDERASPNNNTGQVEDTFFKEVSIPRKGFLGWTRGRARESRRGLPSKRGGKVQVNDEQEDWLDSQRDLKRHSATERQKRVRAKQKNIASAQMPKMEKWLLARPTGIGGLPIGKITHLGAARGNIQAQERLQRGTRSPVVNGEAGAATAQQATEQQAAEQQATEQQDTEQQDVAMQVDTVQKPEFGKQDDDVEVTWESHPR